MMGSQAARMAFAAGPECGIGVSAARASMPCDSVGAPVCTSSTAPSTSTGAGVGVDEGAIGRGLMSSGALLGRLACELAVSEALRRVPRRQGALRSAPDCRLR
jgi:hypothetical protein